MTGVVQMRIRVHAALEQSKRERQRIDREYWALLILGTFVVVGACYGIAFLVETAVGR